MSLHCYKCQTELKPVQFGRQESCPQCRSDTRVCRNCKHYDPAYNNHCKESQALRQVEKEKANFCEWFQVREGKLPNLDRSHQISAAEALFKKKS